MPKKESAKERAAAKADTAAAIAAKAAEDASWHAPTRTRSEAALSTATARRARAAPRWAEHARIVGRNDGGGRNTSKKESAEEKRLAQLAAKAEREALEAEETAGLTNKKAAAPKKMSQAQIQAAFIIPGGKKKKKPEPQPEVERNINHVRREEDAAAAAAGIDVVEASGLTNALSALSAGSGPESPEAHPERRRKAAYAAYEEREIPRLREEYKGLKLSQIKEMIFKNWQKSPENPMNQAQLQ